mmetsp:Transcript_3263/g.11430  ORF Transcript_3263/g.11430 Transcript_3263/m.11430 type:complete len:645 (+) Transcript_3263:41-1975(+)
MAEQRKMAIKSASSFSSLSDFTVEDLTFVTSFHFAVDPHHAPSEVYLAGSFTGWRAGAIKMEREPGMSVFSVTVNLPLGIHSYKFIVDGKWEFAGDQPTLSDENGNINNCLSVTRPLLRSGAEGDSLRRYQDGDGETKKHQLFYNQLLLPGVQQVSKIRKRGPASHQRARSATEEELVEQLRERTPFEPEVRALATSPVSRIIEEAAKRKRNQSLPPSSCYPAFNTPKHRLMLVMVGLPARGKSFISRKLCRYLNWMGYKSRVFNLGNYRRENLGAFHTHEFFDPDNEQGTRAREKIALAVLDDVFAWLRAETGSVAVFDGTNSTRRRRNLILERVAKEKPGLIVKTIFVEIICNDPEVIEANVLATKLKSPDYVNASPEDVIADFRQRIAHYEAAYEPLGKKGDANNLRYIKIFEVGRQIVANRITGYVPGRVMFYLSNLHIFPRPIYLVRHGQSEYNVEERLGGDSPLTELGQQFADKLSEFMDKDTAGSRLQLCVWSSTLKRTIQTAEKVHCGQYISWSILNEIQAGECDGLTYKEVEERFPEEFRKRQEDKLRYRYVRGESYEDVISRLEPVIIELERQQNPILIVAHRAVIRCLYAYIMNKTREEVPFLPVPLHTVIKLTPHSYGTEEERFRLIDGSFD